MFVYLLPCPPAVYLTSLLSLSTMSVLSSGVVMNMIHQDDDKPVPRFLRCLVCCRRRQIRKEVTNGNYKRRLPPPLIEHKSVAGFGIINSQSTNFPAPSQRWQQARNSSTKRHSLHKSGNGTQDGGEIKQQVQEASEQHPGKNVSTAPGNTTKSGGLPATSVHSGYRWSNGDTSRNRQHPTSPLFESKAELRSGGGGSGVGGEKVGVSPITVEREKYSPGFPREAVIRYEPRADGGRDEHYIVTDEESEEREALFDRVPGRISIHQSDLNPDDWGLVTWMDVGSAVDTILFWVFLGITVTSTAVVLILFSAQ